MTISSYDLAKDMVVALPICRKKISPAPVNFWSYFSQDSVTIAGRSEWTMEIRSNPFEISRLILGSALFDRCGARPRS
jgi:hypothetical protein